ncbi:MAG: glycosyltransferase family 4 protein [Muribaculaceae bacterium]|nr:glycosyltransferase family 4 protein [Muribaculaceae bacterium]
MKILLVNKFHYMKGGSERYYFNLAEAFKEKGHEVIFFAMKDEKNIPCAQEKYFVSAAAVNGGLKAKLNMVFHIAYSKEAYKKMKALLNDEKPELVIFNLVHKQITLSILDAIREYNPNLPVFWTMHDLITVCPSYTMLDGNGNICEKCLGGKFENCKKNKCIRGSSLMSSLSVYEAKQIKKRGWYDKVTAYICPSEFYKAKLEEAHFTKSPVIFMRNPLSVDTEYEVNDSDENYILYFGRLAKEKGVKTLINAAKDTGKKLVICGTGPIEEELKKYVCDNKIENIEFKGFAQGEELNGYIKNSRCAALPSEWYENGPYSAMEALALGKPLIVSNNGGLPELVKDGVNGYVYKDYNGLCESIENIFGLDKEKYSELCKSSKEFAERNFNPLDYAEKILELKEKFSKQ